MMRPNQVLFKQLADLGANLISLPIETSGETLIQNITYIKETLGLKVGIWAWQGLPLVFFEPFLSFVDIIEYESRAPFWMPVKPGKSRIPSMRWSLRVSARSIRCWWAEGWRIGLR